MSEELEGENQGKEKRKKEVPKRVRWGERSAKKAEKRWRREALRAATHSSCAGFKVTSRRCRHGFSLQI
jgi:hypothetical protein